MAYKLLAVVVTIIAFMLAIVISFWYQPGVKFVIFVGRFFDVMLPVLGVGALIKYLFTCSSSCQKKE